jgi:peptidoglycan/LPS O-acetylase OafA/YrhL
MCVRLPLSLSLSLEIQFYLIFFCVIVFCFRLCAVVGSWSTVTPGLLGRTGTRRMPGGGVCGVQGKLI